MDPSFSTLFKNYWHTSESLPSSSSLLLSRFQHRLKYLTSNIIDWNKNHFGNLFWKKHRLLARLRGIRLALSCKPSTFLYSLENQLIQDYNHTLHQEFLFWQLKSRITWLNYGDANTKFFHLKTLQHRSQSHITTLKDSSRLWVLGETLTTHITTAFTKLFTLASPHITSQLPLVRYYHHNSNFFEQYQWLSSIPLLEEISRNIFSLLPLKAPGPVGYHTIFFQQNWHILGPSFIHIIQEIFKTTTILEEWEATNLILIPKMNHPDMITHFFLISLCNTLYKLVLRIILQQLKPYIADIINPCQAGFVPGR